MPKVTQFELSYATINVHSYIGRIESTQVLMTAS